MKIKPEHFTDLLNAATAPPSRAHSLETDKVNAAEVASASRQTAPRLALFFYRDRLAEGYSPGCAYAMALAYLRRKTGLSIPLAMASLDELLTEIPS